MIKFEVNQRSGKNISRKIWTKWLNQTDKALKIRKNLEISIAVVGENEIKNLNKTYRGKNEATDVLSFAEIDQKDEDFIKDDSDYIGEVVICYWQAVRQAKTLGHSTAEEIKFLFIHGFLHLLGHNHKKKKEKEKMRGLERKILSQK